MQPNLAGGYSPPSYQSPVGPSKVPEISAASAARGLGDKLPYSGGAMATHKPMGVAGPSGYAQKGTPALNPTHGAYPNGLQGSHTIHDPRFAG